MGGHRCAHMAARSLLLDRPREHRGVSLHGVVLPAARLSSVDAIALSRHGAAENDANGLQSYPQWVARFDHYFGPKKVTSLQPDWERRWSWLQKSSTATSTITQLMFGLSVAFFMK